MSLLCGARLRAPSGCGLTRRAFAEQHAALGLAGGVRFDDLDRHGVGGGRKVAHHRFGNVLDQGALLLERASPDGVNVDFRHIALPRRLWPADAHHERAQSAPPNRDGSTKRGEATSLELPRATPASAEA